MPKWSWLVFLLAVAAWQVVGSLIERANKKQQQERLKELAAQRQRQLAARRGAGPSSGPSDRAETLAARRRAQLEELRQRRERPRPGVQPQMRAGPGAAAPTPAQPSAPSPFRVPPQPSRPAPSRRAPQPQAGIGRPATRAARPAGPVPAPRAPSRQPQQPPLAAVAPAAPREPVDAELKALSSLDAAEVEAKPRGASPQRGVHPLFAAERPTPQVMRRMVVLRELLDLPVALRDRGVLDRL